MTVKVRFFVAMNPGDAAVNNWRRCKCTGGRPGSRPTPEYDRAKATVHACALLAVPRGVAPVFPAGAVEVSIEIVVARQHQKAHAKGLAFLDVDAPIKCVLDGMNGVVYTDDGQITELRVTKVYTPDPNEDGIRVRVTNAL